MAFAEYERLLDWLYALEARRGMDFKLERIELVLEECGQPHRRYPVVHIAGTNGKGSVAAMVEAALRFHGVRTGLYTSPHLVRFSERIRVAGEEISPAEVVRLAAVVHRASTVRGIELTFFEFTTVLAFLYFVEREVEAAVVEVGLGGRLDATNVVDPAVSVITSIGLDHQEFLGSTLESIAAEKAGIIKPGKPVVVGRVDPGPAAVIEAAAAERGAPSRWLGRDFSWTGSDSDWVFRDRAGEVQVGALALRGLHQCDNAAVAVSALRCLPEALRPHEGAVVRGLQQLCWPGRWEVVCESPLVILDGAHNLPGVRCLADEIRRRGLAGRVHLLFGVMADKDWQAMAPELGPLCTTVTLTAPQIRRAARPQMLVPAWAQYAPVRVEEDPLRAFRAVLAACGPEEAVVVTGSLFLLGAVRQTALQARLSSDRDFSQERAVD